jgi:protein SCO1/2
VNSQLIRALARVWVLMALLLGLGMGFATATAQTGTPTSDPSASESPRPGIGGDMRLTDQWGKPFALSTQAPQASLVFFGFTRCTQVCPPALGLMQALSAHMQARRPPRMIFVTLDPLSDSPTALKQYLGRFDARIIGLTGSPAQVEEVARRYGVSTSTRQGVLEHSARLYLLGPDHHVARVYKLHVPLAQLARDILALQSPMLSLRQF